MSDTEARALLRRLVECWDDVNKWNDGANYGAIMEDARALLAQPQALKLVKEETA